ncbi:MAG: hypothetical protein ACOX8B_09175 [Lachnospiraceae bacterium]
MTEGMKGLDNAPMTAERQELFDGAMERLDSAYDAAGGFVSGEVGRRDVRASSHYALGLLMRDGPGDRERACGVIGRILDLQFLSDPEADWYGSYPLTDESPVPPAEPWPGECFTAEARYLLDKWTDLIDHRLEHSLAAEGFSAEQIGRIASLRNQAVNRTIPLVWRTYDANWREFISIEWITCLFAAGRKIPEQLKSRMGEALEKSVRGSVRRRRNYIVPMNTNVELMYALYCELTGELLQREDFRAEGRKAAGQILKKYREFHSFAEYNSSTYYAVDLMTLSLWRQAVQDETFRAAGAEMEEGLWENLSETYHPGLHNLCGPYSRCYEEEMQLHSMLPSILYAALGKNSGMPLAQNTEDPGLIDLALLGVEIPGRLKPSFLSFSGERCFRRQFRELIERGKPGEDTPLCTASGWLSDHVMAGVLSGSRNTSHQLRSAVVHWRTPEGKTAIISLMRRERGKEPGHLRTVFFDNTIERNRLSLTARCDVECDVDIYFRVSGCSLSPEMIEAGQNTENSGREIWNFPGLRVLVRTDAGRPEVRMTDSGMEIAFLSEYLPEKATGCGSGRAVHFDLTLTE